MLKFTGEIHRVTDMHPSGNGDAYGSNWKSGVSFEYSSKETPHQNSLIETASTLIAARSRSLIDAANVPKIGRYWLLPEAANAVMKLDWLEIVTIDHMTKTQIEHFVMQIPKFAKYLHTWGEAGRVKSGKDGKLGDRGITMIMVGYANHHECDVYQMLNLGTGRITETQDIIWLFRIYYKMLTAKQPVVSLQRP